MSKKYNTENCDILTNNGHLILVYDDGVSARQKILAYAKSYHDLNEKAFKILGGEDWMDFLFYMDEEFPDDLITRLLADMYEHHKEVYMNLYNKMYTDQADDNFDSYEELQGDDDYLTMHAIKDEDGVVWFVFDKKSIENLDDEILERLSEDLDIPNYDLKSRKELIDDVCSVKFNADDDEDDCDADCDHCDCDSCVEHTTDDESVNCVVEQYESVNGPQHYNGTECIEEMRNLYGDDAVRWFCICNAYKYRFRKGNKPGVDAAQDESKARWYEKYASDMKRSAQY